MYKPEQQHLYSTYVSGVTGKLYQIAIYTCNFITTEKSKAL